MQQESARKVPGSKLRHPHGGLRGAASWRPCATKSATPPSSTSCWTARRSSSSRRTGCGRGALLGGGHPGILGGLLGIVVGGLVAACSSQSCATPGSRTTRPSSSASRWSPTARRSSWKSPATAIYTAKELLEPLGATELRRGRSRRERRVALAQDAEPGGRARAGRGIERVFQSADGPSAKRNPVTRLTVWGLLDDPTSSVDVVRYVASVLRRLGDRATLISGSHRSRVPPLTT